MIVDSESALQKQLEATKRLYEQRFTDTPSASVVAPGRVNLIGEHVDYNGGFVLPIAIPLYTVIMGKKTNNSLCTIQSSNIQQNAEVVIDLTRPIEPGSPSWANYIKGVMVHYQGKLVGFNAVINSTVPIGSGLSSSAALEVAMFLFLETISEDLSLKRTEKARLCQKAEHSFAGVPCGIMDQLICLCAVEGCATLIDCRSLAMEHVQVSDPNLAILITDSHVHHELSSSEYSERKQSCSDAAAIFEVSSLRDIRPDQFKALSSKLDPIRLRRVRHVVEEIRRTSEAFDYLKQKNFAAFGALMKESHCSLRDDYEVSCYELDQLSDIANSCEGVYGSRMVGAGFGGCTVTLLKRSCADAVMERIKERYGSTCTFYICTPCEGAKVIAMSSMLPGHDAESQTSADETDVSNNGSDSTISPQSTAGSGENCT